MTKEEMDKIFQEQTAIEVRFLNDQGIEPNKHGAYPFVSSDGNVLVALDLFLHSYRTWLIENDIHRER